MHPSQLTDQELTAALAAINHEVDWLLVRLANPCTHWQTMLEAYSKATLVRLNLSSEIRFRAEGEGE